MGRLVDIEPDLQFIQQMAGFNIGQRILKEEEKNENPGEQNNALTKILLINLTRKN